MNIKNSYRKYFIAALLITILAAAFLFAADRIDEKIRRGCINEAERLSGGLTPQVQLVPASESDIPAPFGEFDGEMLAKFDEISKKYNAVSVQAAFIRDGSVVSDYSFGYADISAQTPVTPQSRFRVASLSKLCTDITVMTLCDSGKMKLDGDIGTYLGWRVRNPKAKLRPLTPAQLMSHTSSLVDSAAFNASCSGGSSQTLKTLLENETSFSDYAPGKGYNYSNFGIAVLAAAAEKRIKTPFYKYSETALFSPLGLGCSYLASELKEPETVASLYDVYHNSTKTAEQQMRTSCCITLGKTHHIYQGNLTCSAREYAELICMLLRGGTSPDGGMILTDGSVREMLTSRLTAGGCGHGFGVSISEKVIGGRKIYFHTGSSYGVYCCFVFDDLDKTGAVVITSGADARREESGLYDICGDIIRGAYRV